jgi:hypothetical protein
MPPTTLDEVIGDASAVVVGRLGSARVDGPRRDDLEPYEGAGRPLRHLEVVVDVEVIDVVAGTATGGDVRIRIPVISSGGEGVGTGRPAGDRIVTATPVGATAVFLVFGEGGELRPIALASSTGELIGFYASMDRAVDLMDLEGLAGALADRLPQ